MIAWSAQPPSDGPRSDEAHLWRVDLDGAADAEVLDGEEKVRAARFIFDRDRARFIAGRSALRRILAAYLGAKPAELSFETSRQGHKPALAGDGNDLCFNMSKADGAGLIAIAQSRAVGVDIEPLHRETDIDLIARDQFSADEQATLRRLPPELRREGFFRGWTGKEALIKLTGEGLAARLSAIAIEIDPAKPLALLAGYGAYEPSRLTLVGGRLEPNFLFALAIEGPAPDLTGFALQPETQ